MRIYLIYPSGFLWLPLTALMSRTRDEVQLCMDSYPWVLPEASLEHGSYPTLYGWDYILVYSSFTSTRDQDPLHNLHTCKFHMVPFINGRTFMFLFFYRSQHCHWYILLMHHASCHLYSYYSLGKLGCTKYSEIH